MNVQSLLPEARAVTHHHGRTFALATRFLPHHMRGDVYLLYMVMRTLDDLVDHGNPAAPSILLGVQSWAQGGEIAGREAHILAYLCARYPHFPREAVSHFCQGQLESLDSPAFDTELDLDRHAYLVAGTVGRMMTALLGAEGAEADRAARALGIAMQRTNILRDIDEDLSRGRVYIPRHTLQAAGIRDLARDDRRELLRLQVATAEGWYRQGLAGVHLLRAGRWPIRAAALMYREILWGVQRAERQRVRPRRVVVSRPRKAVLVARALLPR